MTVSERRGSGSAPSQQQQLHEKRARQNSLQYSSQRSQQQQPELNGGEQHTATPSTGALTHRTRSTNSNNQESSRRGQQELVWMGNARHSESMTSLRHHGPKTPFRDALDMYQMLRYRSGKIINHNKVQLFIVTLIAINAIMMGIGTYPFIKDNPQAHAAFETTDLIFLIIFTIELAMQFLFHGWRLILDGWLVFDLVIIVTSWSFSEVQIIRAFRIFRALRLITRIKVMKNLVLALFGVMPRMFAIGLLLLLVSYIFAVMFTQLFKDLYKRGLTSVDYFGRMDDTFFTLFQIMTLDAWAEIAREVMAVYAWAWLPFIVFVIITGFVVVNLIIAVICDAISALHDDEKAKIHGTYEVENEYYDDDGNYLGGEPTFSPPPLRVPAAQEPSNRSLEPHNDNNNSTRKMAADVASSKSNREHDSHESPQNNNSVVSTGTISQQRQNVEVQLDALESHVEDLTKMQEQTILTLEILTRELQAQRAARQGAQKAAAVSVVE